MFLGKHLKHKVLIKFVPESLETRGLKYELGQIVEDKFPFSTGDCEKGGLHFTWLKWVSEWTSMGTRAFLVTIPDDALVCLYGKKGKASKLVLSDEVPFARIAERAEKVRYLLKRTDRADLYHLMKMPFEELCDLEKDVRLRLKIAAILAFRGLDHLQAFSMNREELESCEFKIGKCDKVFRKHNAPYSELFGLTIEQLGLYRALKFLGDFSAIEKAKAKKELVSKAYHPTGQTKDVLLTLSDSELEVLAIKKEAYLFIRGSKWDDIKNLSVEQVRELVSVQKELDSIRKEKLELIKKITKHGYLFKSEQGPGSVLGSLEKLTLPALELMATKLPWLLEITRIRRCRFLKYAFLTPQELDRHVLEKTIRLEFWSRFRDDKARLREMSLEDLKTFNKRSSDMKIVDRYSLPGMTLEKAIAMPEEEFREYVKQITPARHDPLEEFFQDHLVITGHPMETVGTTKLWEFYVRRGPKPRVDRSKFLKRCSKYLNQEPCRRTISGERLQRFAGVELVE